MKPVASFWEVFRETWRLVVIEGFISVVIYLLEDKNATLNHVITRLRQLADDLEQRYLIDVLDPRANSSNLESDSLTPDQGQQ